MDKKIIVIVGPTASGKTGIGVKLAKKFNGEIVSADSRQVYRGLDIGTGKDLEEYGDIKYHLIDVKNPGEKFSLFDYLPLAKQAIEDILSRGKLPIIVGGTGLYVQALVEGFRLTQNSKLKIQNQNLKFKNFSRQELDNKTTEQLREILIKIDKEAYNALADKQNPCRLIRAIERAQEGLIVAKEKPDWNALQIGIEWPREVLNQRIDKRVDDRFKQGMLDEVVGLINSGVDPDWLLKLGLEYRIIGNFLISNLKLPISNQIQISDAKKNYKINNLELDKSLKFKIENSLPYKQMVDELKTKSHQYAKRQMTWFKRFPEIKWEKDYKKIEDRVKNFLNS